MFAHPDTVREEQIIEIPDTHPQSDRSSPSRGHRRSVTVLIVVTLFTMILLDRPLVRGDGTAYLVWIDTLVLDQDVNLNNQHDRFRTVNTYQIEWSFEREQWVNIFPFGIAFVQAPFYGTGHLFNALGWLDVSSDYFQQMQGITLPYSFWLMIGANLMALVTVILAWRIGTYLVDPWTAALVAYTVFVGTPLIYYSTVSPVNSHNPGAFAVACFVYVLIRVTMPLEDQVRGFQARPPQNTVQLSWVLLGVFAGLMALIRWQLILVAIPAWALIVAQRQWRGFGIATAAAVVTLLPLPVIWNTMFGTPFLVPYDSVNDQAFMQNQTNHAWDVLVELVTHSPVVLLSLIGIPVLWRLNRVWALVFVGIFVLQLAVNGAALDWNAGDSYGMRRMSELAIVYAVLVCAAVRGVMQWASKTQTTYTVTFQRLSWLMLLVLVAYSGFYMAAFLNYTWTSPDGLFSASPKVMIDYWFSKADRFAILWEVYRTHVGPLAWEMPGP